MKIGIIGTSKISELFVSALIESKLFELEAVYSRTLEKAQQFSEKYGFKNCFTDLDKMAKSNIDIVYIASPNSLHFSQACLFLENKKHVICEKPMVTSVEEFNEMVSKANENNVFLFEAFRHINSPIFDSLKQAITEIGTIRSVSFSYNQYSSKYDNFKKGIIGTSFDPNYQGGALNDLGVYPISIACALFGYPNSVFKLKIPLENGIDGACGLVLNYKTFVCTINCSKIAKGLIKSEIIGELGGILIDKISEIREMDIYLNDGTIKNVHIDKIENDMIYEIQRFYEIIVNNDMEKYESLTKISKDTNFIL